MPTDADPTVPPFHGNISFNAQHAPMGAFFSFTCGHFGTRGGFGLQIGQPGNQDLYIGVKDGDRSSDSPLKCLPFFTGGRSGAGAADFQVEQAAGPAEQNVKPKVVAYTKDEIQRHYGWATDRWVTKDFEFTIYTPFGEITDPFAGPQFGLRNSVLPADVAEMTIDNTAGSTKKTGLFAIRFPDPGVRLLDRNREPYLDHHVGFAWRRQFAAEGCVSVLDRDGQHGAVTSLKAFPVSRWSPDEGLADANPVHLLGSCPGLGFEVPPGQCYALRLVLACFLDGVVTTRLEGRYFYTRCFSGLPDVIDHAWDEFDRIKIKCAGLDGRLVSSGLSADQQFLIAHATRSYYGSTQLLDVGGQPYWVVNEGEYCMMNTLDLSVDHVFWELEHNPWVVRNLLDNFVRHYSYVDQVKDPKTGELHEGGLSFCHDQGVHNNFSPFGHSSYELPDLTGCFSYMTQEQLCNWILIAACYVAATEDMEWLRRNGPTIFACSQSMENRLRDGTMGFDSARCGTGQEITTYDSLDASLGQARQNLYIAVKCWAAHLGLVLLLDRLGSTADADVVNAERNASVVQAHLNGAGFIPAVFERANDGFRSRILPAIEALLYPRYWASTGSSLQVTNTLYREERCVTGLPLDEDGPFRDLLSALRRHTLTLLTDPERRNLFADGGIKLSSTSNNSWMSKIALFQHVAREVFRLDDDPVIAELFTTADAAHVKWQTEGASAYWACSDQFVNGVAQGSRYYPRIITTALWLNGRKARKPS